MSRGKGRVSNELVAASCAAVLTVYAAGYWRTRDVAKRMEAQAHERRPTHAEPSPPLAAAIAATVEVPAAVAAVAEPARQPEPVTALEPAAPKKKLAPEAAKSPSLKVADAAPAKKAPAIKPTAPPPPAQTESVPVATPQIASVPLPSEEPVPAPESLPVPDYKWKDGTYTGWGQSNHGDLEVEVVISGGRIVKSGVKTCATRYPCDVIDVILNQPVKRQNAEVDTVSRATESADAYYYGLVEALKQALE